MWKDNLIILKEKRGVSNKQIADGVKTSESTINRIFSKAKEDCKRGHSMDLIIAVIRFLGGSFGEVFEDTGAVVGGSNFREMQEKINALTTENASLMANLDLVNANNAIFQSEISSLSKEIEALKIQNMYKDKIISLLEIIEQKKEK